MPWLSADIAGRVYGTPVSVLFLIFLLFLAEFSKDKFQKTNKYKIQKFNYQTDKHLFLPDCVRISGQSGLLSLFGLFILCTLGFI
jgi:hypothetical protein